MKKISLSAIAVLSIMLLPAQGIYQLWGVKHTGGVDELGSIYSMDASGNNFHIRHQITAINPGNLPQYSKLIQYNGKFYGVTSGGGKYGYGVIFEWDSATNVYTKKFDFDGTTGGTPWGGLALFNNKFYGITTGGYLETAVIFEWDPGTDSYTMKLDFSTTDGVDPIGDLVPMGDKLYGMTSGGGAHAAGEIFEWDPATNIYAKKVDFGSVAGDGGVPCGNLVPFNGKFYGMTTYGGGSLNGGIIFEWDPGMNAYTVKFAFDNTGNTPHGSLSLLGSQFYGITNVGGSNNFGAFFQWNPATNVYIKKLDFGANDGNFLAGSLTPAGGKLYGMTTNGGISNTGEIFEYDTAANALKKRIDLKDSTGDRPTGSLLWSGGKFYGMTDAGGFSGHGALFEWDTATNIYNIKIDLDKRECGVYPARSLTYFNGKLYGMAAQGGKNDKGTIFEFDPAINIYTKKFDLDVIGGNLPTGSLTVQNGKFYGTTQFGGPGQGILFEWDPATGTGTHKVDFISNGNNQGLRPEDGLTAFNGKFYGMTLGGGVNSEGVIFEWDTATNILTKKIDLDELNGSEGLRNLTLYNGKFYGTTFEGGINTLGGVIFEWDPVTNIYTKKVDFDGLNGYQPMGALTFYNGKFYGTTNGGGINSSGIIFEWDPATNLFTKKFDFGGTGVDGYLDGFYPYGTLTMSGGKFYGVSSTGGFYHYGVIYEWDPATSIYTKKRDLDEVETGLFEWSQDLTLAPAPLPEELPGSCTTFPQVTIDNTNNNTWIAVTDTLGNAVAEINAHGNNLGVVNSSMYLNGGPVREDGAKKLYLDMNLTITPQVQPTSPVDIRVYIKNTEFTALKNAVNSDGQPSGINSINDVAIFKNEDNSCEAATRSIANPVITTAASWQNDYVLTASINSFSSLYFANKTLSALPLTLLEFGGRLQDKIVLLNWKTASEQNVSRFEIERSIDGINYIEIGTTESTGTEGTHTYSFNDAAAFTLGKEVIYYRLKQTDNDGRFTYSRIIIISIDNNNGCLLFPNPVAAKANLCITISKPQQVKASVIDNTGKKVKEFRWNLPAGTTSLSIDVSGLAKGIYFLDMKGATINEHKPFTRQ